MNNLDIIGAIALTARWWSWPLTSLDLILAKHVLAKHVLATSAT